MAKTVHLIECGDFTGTAVTDLKVGDRLLWNYGAITEVVSLAPKGKGMLITERWESRTTEGVFQTGTRYRRADVVRVVSPKKAATGLIDLGGGLSAELKD